MSKFKRMYIKMTGRAKSGGKEPVPSIVGEGTRVRGNIVSDGIVHIDGRLEGDVVCDELVVGVKGSVKGSVKAASLQLYGVLNGKTSADRLFIAKTARLVGDATHSSIAIEPGAYIDGHCIRANATIVPFETPEEGKAANGKSAR